jgi:hypothetical protein
MYQETMWSGAEFIVSLPGPMKSDGEVFNIRFLN